VHTTFSLTSAATGRIASQDPNLQNIPIRTEIGREIRQAFIAAPGTLLVAADYSQIELRILAHLSRDPVLCQAFTDRIDVHTQTAAQVFHMPTSQVTAKERRVAKAVNYGLMYGQTDFGLARALDISRHEAKEYSDAYFKSFPTIRAFMQSVVEEAKRLGGSNTIFGRFRPIPELVGKNAVARKQGERIAQNTPMQGAGADIIKFAMLRAQEMIDKDKWPAKLLLTVPDELVFEVAEDAPKKFGVAIQKLMEQVVTLSVPLEVDVGIARNWSDA